MKEYPNQVSRLWLSLVGDFFIETLFPHSCYLCGAEGSYLCTACYEKVNTFPHPICPHCEAGLPLGMLAKKCRQELGMERLFTCASYRDATINKLIKDMKYKRAYALAEPVAELFIWWLGYHNYQKEFLRNALLVPVPSHKRKLKHRGFNPAENIARHISEALGIPLCNDILIKTGATKPQVETKNRTERQENIKGTFATRGVPGTPLVAMRDKTIILVDDVITTGATMRECARTLRRAGVRNVWGIAIAKD